MDDRWKPPRTALIAQEWHEVLEGASSCARGAGELEEGAAARQGFTYEAGDGISIANL